MSFKDQYSKALNRLCGMLEQLKDDRMTNIREIMASLANGADTDAEFYMSLVENIDVFHNQTTEIRLKNISGIWKIMNEN